MINIESECMQGIDGLNSECIKRETNKHNNLAWLLSSLTLE